MKWTNDTTFTESTYQSRLGELEGMFKNHSLSLRTAGELDAARRSFAAWKEYRLRHDAA